MTALGSIRWIALALLGLALAAAVSLAASRLVSQRIGLAAEPVSAGRELAPPRAQGSTSGSPGSGHAGGQQSTPTATTTTVPPTTTVAPTTTPPTAVPPPPSNPPAGGGEGDTGGSGAGADD